MSKDVKDLKECPQACLGEFSPGRGASSANTGEQESVCVQGRARRQVWLEDREIEMRFSVWPDHVGLQHIRRCLMSVKDVHS